MVSSATTTSALGGEHHHELVAPHAQEDARLATGPRGRKDASLPVYRREGGWRVGYGRVAVSAAAPTRQRQPANLYGPITVPLTRHVRVVWPRQAQADVGAALAGLLGRLQLVQQLEVAGCSVGACGRQAAASTWGSRRRQSGCVRATNGGRPRGGSLCRRWSGRPAHLAAGDCAGPPQVTTLRRQHKAPGRRQGCAPSSAGARHWSGSKASQRATHGLQPSCAVTTGRCKGGNVNRRRNATTATERAKCVVAERANSRSRYVRYGR
jgi:hypothetical protein